MRSSFFLVALASLPFAAACGAFTGVDSDGLVQAADDGDSGSESGRRDSGTRDSGSRDGSTSNFDSGSIESMGPECTSLQSCCDFLDTTTAVSCRSTALAEDESTCESDLLTYQEEGLCSGITPPVDSGTTPPVDSGLPTGDCATLLNCCATVSDPSCVTTAIAGDDSACQTLWFQYVLDGVCAE